MGAETPALPWVIRHEPMLDFQISFVDVRDVGFAGLLIKSDNLASVTMRHVHLNNNYIHDTGREGMHTY